MNPHMRNAKILADLIASGESGSVRSHLVAGWVKEIKKGLKYPEKQNRNQLALNPVSIDSTK